MAIDVTAAQLTQTTFQSGSGTDDLWMRASDGTDWGAWQEFHVAAPVDAQPQQAAPAAPAAPRTVSASQLGYLVPPNPIYPARSRKVGEEGKVMVRVLVDVTGRPAQVSMQTSSGHPELDQSALSAVRAAQFRPYAEGGIAQAVWVLVPINFVLR